MLPILHSHRQYPPSEPSPLLKQSIRDDLHTYLSCNDPTPIVDSILSSMRSTSASKASRSAYYLKADRRPFSASNLSITSPVRGQTPCSKIWIWDIADGNLLISFPKSVFDRCGSEKKIRLGRLYCLSESTLKTQWVALAKFKDDQRRIERTVQIHTALEQVPHTLKLLSALVYQKQGSSLVDRTALLFPFYARGDLFDNLTRNTFPTELALRKFQFGIITAMEAIHQEGWVYRDLKLENILLSNNQSAVVCDLGSACKVTALQSIRSFTGTIEYSAPELLRFFHCIGYWIAQPRKESKESMESLTSFLTASMAGLPLLRDLLIHNTPSIQSFPNPHTFSQEALKAKEQEAALMRQRLYLLIIRGFQILCLSSLLDTYEYLLNDQWEKKPLNLLTAAIDAWSLGLVLQQLEPLPACRASTWLKAPLAQHKRDLDLLLLANNISSAAERDLPSCTPEPWAHMYHALLQPDPRHRMSIAQAKRDWQKLLEHAEQVERSPVQEANPLERLNPQRSFSLASSNSEESLSAMYLPPGVQPPPPPQQSTTSSKSSCCTCS